MPGFQSTRLVTEGALEPFFFLYTDDSIQGNTETCKQSSIMLNYEVKNNKVVAVTPIAYMEYIRKFLLRKNVLAIELCDTPEHIFDRLVFSDENDVVYQDDDYKNAHKEYYLKEISEDIRYYGKHSFKIIKNKFNMDGKEPALVVARLIEEYRLL